MKNFRLLLIRTGRIIAYKKKNGRNVKMENEKRLEAFEKMLEAVKNNYETADNKMKRLKAEGKEKSATYRQFFGHRMFYKQMLEIYRKYNLTD